MKPAAWPRGGARATRLLHLDPDAPPGWSFGSLRIGDLRALLREGDLLVVNDAATMPASLRGVTAAGLPVEVRLIGGGGGGRGPLGRRRLAAAHRRAAAATRPPHGGCAALRRGWRERRRRPYRQPRQSRQAAARGDRERRRAIGASGLALFRGTRRRALARALPRRKAGAVRTHRWGAGALPGADRVRGSAVGRR